MIPTSIVLGLGALLVVLVLLLWQLAQRRTTALLQQIEEQGFIRDDLMRERDSLVTDTAMLRAQIRPLADEVDRLKRSIAKRDKADTAVTAPATEAPTPAEPAFGLQDLKGVGDKFAAQLRSLGVASIAQIAGWNSADIASIDAVMGAFHGRIIRDRLVEQAKLLHENRVTEFETRFGKLAN